MNFIDSNGDPKIVNIVVTGTAVVLAVVLVLGSVGTVEAGSRGIKTRFNAVVDTLEPGLYFKIPFVESVKDMDVRTQTIQYDRDNIGALAAASKDLQDVAISISVNYRVDPTQAAEIFKQYRSTANYDQTVIQPIVRDSIKSTASQYTAEELVTKRAEFNDKATQLLTERLQGRLVVLERVNITNLDFSESFSKAIESKVTAEQEALAVKNQLERTKYEAEQKVVTAQGNADATLLNAKAEAEAIRIKTQAITSQGGEDYIELKRIEQWNGAGCTQYCGMDTSTGLLIQR